MLSTITIVFLCSVTLSFTNENEPFWPPSNISALIDPKDGRINLALKPRLISTPRTGYWASYYELLITSLASDVKLDPKSSQLKRMVDAQQTLLQQPNRPQYSLYPQVLNMREIVRDVRSGKPLEEVSCCLQDASFNLLSWFQKTIISLVFIDTSDVHVDIYSRMTGVTKWIRGLLS